MKARKYNIFDLFFTIFLGYYIAPDNFKNNKGSALGILSVLY